MHLFGRPFDAQFDVPAKLGVVNAWQAEHLDAAEPRLDSFHQGRERGFHGPHDDDGFFHVRLGVEMLGIEVV